MPSKWLQQLLRLKEFWNASCNPWVAGAFLSFCLSSPQALAQKVTDLNPKGDRDPGSGSTNGDSKAQGIPQELTLQEVIDRMLILRNRLRYAEYETKTNVKVRGVGYRDDDSQFKFSQRCEVDFTRKRARINNETIIAFEAMDLLQGNFFDIRAIGLSPVKSTLSNLSLEKSIEECLGDKTGLMKASLKIDSSGEYVLTNIVDQTTRYTLHIDGAQGYVPTKRLIEIGTIEPMSQEFKVSELVEEMTIEWTRDLGIAVPRSCRWKRIDRYRPFGPATEMPRTRFYETQVDFDWTSVNRSLDIR